MKSRGNRRDFLKTLAAGAVLGAAGLSASGSSGAAPAAPAGGPGDREYWLSVLERLADPVLRSLSRRQLRKSMPVESSGGPSDRGRYTHLEAFGRVLAGVAPWLALRGLDGAEVGAQARTIELARASLDAATDSASPDFMNFSSGGQPLVDTAFLAQGILRAPSALWEPLEERVKRQVVEAFKSSRKIPTPRENNWVMFAAMVEVALSWMGEPVVEDRLDECLRRMLGWYAGDGAYGDGEWFRFDYYNSFVIQPMLLDVLGILERRDVRYGPPRNIVLQRARRYAEVQERLIAPDGTFPSMGRSTTYRFGALQLLGQISLMRELPESINPAQVRCAMTAVIRRMMEAPGTFDEAGWLRIGFCGHQPGLGEAYISTGSLYLCAAGLLPLGLPPEDPFWASPAARWTSQKLWSGEPAAADHAIKDVRADGFPGVD